jgi:hypothetical protein
MRSTFAIKAVAAAIFSHVAFSAAADVPTVDIESTCSIAATAMVQLMGNSTVDSDRNICLGSERGAHTALSKDWGSYPAEDRDRCVQTRVYLPSYVEWLTCLEMERDVRKMRINQPNPRAPITLPKVTPGRLW